jgi:hypothetical protein
MTFGTMIDRIEDEILRADLNSNVQSAIKSAIQHYESRRFWFTEGNNDADSVATVTNSTTYTLSSEWIEIDSFTVEVSSNEYQLIPRTVDWFREINTNPTTVTGIPTDYAFHNNTFWLYPTANGAYPLRIYGHRKITGLDASGNLTLTDTSITNNWFTDAEELIRNRAKYYLYADVLASPERAAFYGGEGPDGSTRGREGEALMALDRRTRSRIATGTIQPVYF